MNTYELSRIWFDFCFENTDKITPNHTALYFFCIEQCNRMGWKERFGLSTNMAKDAIGMRSYNTYINTLNDLVNFGFIILVEKSKNQYSSNIIALSKFTKALDKALDKAFIKHVIKQDERTIQSTSESISSIDKQYNNITKEQRNNKHADLIFPFNSEDFLKAWNDLLKNPKWKKKPITALHAALKKLGKETEADAIKMLENATVGNWQGLFSLNANEKTPKGINDHLQAVDQVYHKIVKEWEDEFGDS